MSASDAEVPGLPIFHGWPGVRKSCAPADRRSSKARQRGTNSIGATASHLLGRRGKTDES